MPKHHPWSSEPHLSGEPDPVHWTRLAINPKLATQGLLLSTEPERMEEENGERERKREREVLCVVGLSAKAHVKVLACFVLSEG